ncbi:MAG: hypothetical protein QW228_05110 [Candidatus Aenigmatarchaeota archaeon]
MFEGLKIVFKKLISALYSPNLEEMVKERVAEDLGVEKEKLPEVEYKPLPFIYVITKYGRIVLGKIRGAYDSIRNKIYIDPIDYFFSPFREKIKILAEEFYHAAENVKGKLKFKYKNFLDYLKNYEDDENEIRAKRYAEDLAYKIEENLGSLSLYST